MRINFDQGTQPAAETTQAGAQNAAAANGQAAASSLALGEDQARISGAHAEVQKLAAQASQLPEVRQEKVQALRQTLGAGRYRPSPEKVAHAMLAEMVAGPAA